MINNFIPYAKLPKRVYMGTQDQIREVIKIYGSGYSLQEGEDIDEKIAEIEAKLREAQCRAIFPWY